jgi:hypothetical protein
MKDQI